MNNGFKLKLRKRNVGVLPVF